MKSTAPMKLPKCFQPFLTAEAPADVSIELFPGAEKICPQGTQVGKNVYSTEAGILQRYLWKDEQYFVRIEPMDRPGFCRLGIPEEFFPDFCNGGNWLKLLAIERLLMPFGRAVIHAAGVILDGKAYLFVAPSEGGKSTQANLWEQRGAEILNGDKIILSQEEAFWYAWGSPVAGSSGIYKNKRAPLAAVFMVNKSPENSGMRLSKRNGFLHLYSNAVKSEWDCEFNVQLLNLLEKVAMKIPVYQLNCNMELSAVDCALECLKG